MATRRAGQTRTQFTLAGQLADAILDAVCNDQHRVCRLDIQLQYRASLGITLTLCVITATIRAPHQLHARNRGG